MSGFLDISLLWICLFKTYDDKRRKKMKSVCSLSLCLSIVCIIVDMRQWIKQNSMKFDQWSLNTNIYLFSYEKENEICTLLFLVESITRYSRSRSNRWIDTIGTSFLTRCSTDRWCWSIGSFGFWQTNDPSRMFRPWSDCWTNIRFFCLIIL